MACVSGRGPFWSVGVAGVVDQDEDGEERRQQSRQMERAATVPRKRGRPSKAAIAAAGGDGEAEALRQTIKRIDKAASKGVIHKNTAARKKSRLAARIKALGAE